MARLEDFARVTDLIDYMFCPRKVYLKRVLGLEEEKREEALFGNIVHDVFDKINEAEEEIVYDIIDDYPFDYILKLYESFAEKIIREVLEKYDDEIKSFGLSKDVLFLNVKKHVYEDLYERAKNVYNTMKAYNEYGIFLWDKLEPKIKSELEVLSNKLKLVGRIDRVEFYKDYAIPIEIKSGNSARSHIIQLHAYALLLKENFPKYKVDLGILYYTKLKKKKEIKLKRKYYNKVIELKDKVIEIIEDKKDPGINEYRRCRKCTFFEVCWKELKNKK